MDPKACIQRIIEAVKSEDWDEANEGLTDLFDWLNLGGFAPSLPPATYITIALGGPISYNLLSSPDGSASFYRYVFNPKTGRSEETHRFYLPKA
jgi:hypothetical protein